MVFRRSLTVSFTFGHIFVRCGRLMSTRKLPPIDAEGYNLVRAPLPSLQTFFRETLPRMGWTSGKKEETVMDAGCGNGMVTVEWIAPLFPSLNKIIAVDLQPGMIEQAILNYPHPKVEYNVANIENWSDVKTWEGQFTKFISALCFHWLKDQPGALRNAYRLLQHGGEAALFFPINSSFYNAHHTILKDPKWQRYFQAVDCFVSEPEVQDPEASHYKKMVEEEGFTITHIKAIPVADEMPMADYKNFLTSVCVLVNYVPPELRDEFKTEFVQYLLLENDVVEGEMPVLHSTMMELVIKKN